MAALQFLTSIPNMSASKRLKSLMLIAPSVTKRLADERASQGAWAEARQMCNLFVCIAVEFIVATRNFVRGK
jgi:hypothetical protein